MLDQTIFVVDDNYTNLAAVAEALEDQYKVVTLPSAVKMFSIMEKLTPNMILLDVTMPDIDGFEAIGRLKANPAHAGIPVIFLTGLHDHPSEARGIELGAVDFITKPFSKAVLLNRIKTHLNIDGIIRERTEQLFLLHNNIVFTLADLVESRDANTGGHIARTTAYLKTLADAMLTHEVYVEEMSGWNMESFVSSARMHDVGKIMVPDAILNKAGPLTAEELKVMKQHPAEGKKIIEQMIRRTGESVFLSSARQTAAYHHERWDGSGYPYGLSGADIPLEARVMAIVDVYDALTSVRSYKEALTSGEAYRMITGDAGRLYDPRIVGAFVAAREEIEAAKDDPLRIDIV